MRARAVREATAHLIEPVIPIGDVIQLKPDVEQVVYSQNRHETECSACGRFIGSWERCPFCRHFNPKRWQVRAIKYSMPILTILGIFLLSFMGKIYGTQQVAISALTRKSNFAQVRLVGRVSDDIRFHTSDQDSNSGSLEFEVDDGTDTIRIRCYDDVCAEMQAARKIPGFGDQVNLIGNYQYKARRHFIILSSPADLEIQRERPERATPIGWLGKAKEKGLKENQRVKITGRIQNVRPGQYGRSLLMEDPFGTAIGVSLSASCLDVRGNEDPAVKFCEGLQVGDYVTCYGTLAQSKSRTARTWQLMPAAPDDLVLADDKTWRDDNVNP